MHHLEDFTDGATFQLGTTAVVLEEVLAFGRRFDPQPFHTDPEAAARHSFGGIVASGWHTAALCQRLFVDALLVDVASLGGSGIDDVRFPRPVRPGDVLAAQARVLRTRPSEHKPDRGTVTFALTARNQRNETVLTLELAVRCRRRGAEDHPTAIGAPIPRPSRRRV